MKYRKPRIVWSVAWGIAAVLLAVLWVRSYFHGEGLLIPVRPADGMRLASYRGRIRFEPDARPTRWEWRIEPEFVPKPDFDWDRWKRNTPHWSFEAIDRIYVPH
jgi:hypothetical protein